MFTGIIQTVGTITRIESDANDQRLYIALGSIDIKEVNKGDSVAVNGVCLTAADFTDDCMLADVSAETLSCTTLGDAKVDDEVNLEMALTPSSRLGGHLVSGHVDGVGVVLDRFEDGRSEKIEIEVPTDLSRYIAAKGSVCVDGVSLTVNEVQGSRFGVNIVPHTMQNTNLSRCAKGVQVNLEIDVIARYLERLLLNGGAGGDGSEKVIWAGDGPGLVG